MVSESHEKRTKKKERVKKGKGKTEQPKVGRFS